MPSSCPTCTADLPGDAVFCHRCGSAIAARPDPVEQVRHLEMRLMDAETQKAEVEARWLRERDEQRSEAQAKLKSARALGYNLVGLAVLLLMLGYLFAGAMWLRGATIDRAGAWVLAALVTAFVVAIGLLVASEVIESAARRDSRTDGADVKPGRAEAAPASPARRGI